MDKFNNSDDLTDINIWWTLKKLIDVIKHESRFVIQEPYKSFVDSIVQMIQNQFTLIMPSSSKLYRARINTIEINKKSDEIKTFPPEEMGPPPQHFAISGRINPEGISYLYCAGDADTAGAELRPWKGAHLTIGEVEIKQDITIADLTLECKDDKWDFYFDDFAGMFSKQWPPELKLNYLVTQYFSEHFKSVGIRGIKYKSEFNVGGDNYALFYKDDYEIGKTYSVETSDISYFFYNKDKNV